MKSIIVVVIASLLVMTSFSPERESFCRRQGLTGHVYLVRGNQMPSPDRPISAPAGMRTKLFIYELTNTSQATGQQGAFYQSVSTRLVKEVSTDEKGFFRVKLKPGMYSLFVKKGDLFYSNIYDDKNNIHPVEVKKGEWTTEDFKADYDAVY